MDSTTAKWVPTTAAALALGCSAQYLKKSRDIKGGFLEEGTHYRLPFSRNASNVWDIQAVQKALEERGRRVHKDRLSRKQNQARTSPTENSDSENPLEKASTQLHL